jgi:hypothetical protein
MAIDYCLISRRGGEMWRLGVAQFGILGTLFASFAEFFALFAVKSFSRKVRKGHKENRTGAEKFETIE